MEDHCEMTVEEMVKLVHHVKEEDPAEEPVVPVVLIPVAEPPPVPPVDATPVTIATIPPFVAEKKTDIPVYRAKSPSLNPVVILEDCLSPAALKRRASPIKRRVSSPSLSPSPSPSPPPIKKKKTLPPTPTQLQSRPPSPKKLRSSQPPPSALRRKQPPPPVKRKPVQPPPMATKRKAEPPSPTRVTPKKRGRSGSDNVPLALSCELTDWCAALTCSNNRTDQPNIAYFPFPRESERCKQWARNAEREDLVHKPSDYLNRNMVLCAKHFEDDQFFNATLRKRLMWDAVPTIFGPLITKKKPPNPPKASQNTTGHSKISPFRRSTAILPAVKSARKSDGSLVQPDAASPKSIGPVVLSNGVPSVLKTPLVISTSKNKNNAARLGQQVSPPSENDANHVYVSITPIAAPDTTAEPTQPTLIPVVTPANNTRKKASRAPYIPPPTLTFSSTAMKQQASSTGTVPIRQILPAPTIQTTPAANANLRQSIAVRSPSFVPINTPVVAVASSSTVPVKSPTSAVVPAKSSFELPPSRTELPPTRAPPVVVYPPQQQQQQRPYPTKSSDIIALMRNHLKEPYISFLGLLLHRSVDKRVWTQSAHRLLLILYLHSPPQYHVLAQMFHLPRRKKLTKWLQNVIPFYPGTQLRHVDLVHQAALNANSTVQLRFQRKSCIVTFRMMAVTPQLRYDAKRDLLEGVEDFGRFGRSRYAATHMLVFMAKGLQTKWTLPIAAYPVSPHVPPVIIRDLLLGTLNHVEMLGLHTKVIVCSGTVKHMTMFQELDYTVTKPYVSFRGRRIMVMMDPAYLFQRLHRMLCQYDLQAGKDAASYTHIEKFYELDAGCSHRLAPSLGPSDVHPETANFRAARHLFSASVATGLHTYVAFEQLPPEVSGTANVIELVSQLMDCFTGRKLRPPVNRPLACVMTETSGHINFLSQLLIGIKNWYFVATSDDNTQLPPDPCIIALYKTVSSLLQLWFELKKFTRDHTLHTARFTTREPRLMKMMRRATKEGVTDASSKTMPAPTTSVMRKTLTEFSTRMVLASPHHLKKLKAHSMFVELLVDRLKSEIQERIPPKTATAKQASTKKSSTLPLKDSSATKLSSTAKQKAKIKQEDTEPTHSIAFPPVNTVSYMAGHLAQSLLKNHDTCEICNSQWVQHPPPKTAAVELFALWLGKASGSVEPAVQFLVPSGSFVSFVTRCEELFMECFPYVLHMDRLSKRVVCFIRRKLDKDTQFVSCPAIRRGLVGLFVELRIEHAVSSYNTYLSKRKKPPKQRIHIAPL